MELNISWDAGEHASIVRRWRPFHKKTGFVLLYSDRRTPLTPRLSRSLIRHSDAINKCCTILRGSVFVLGWLRVRSCTMHSFTEPGTSLLGKPRQKYSNADNSLDTMIEYGRCGMSALRLPISPSVHTWTRIYRLRPVGIPFSEHPESCLQLSIPRYSSRSATGLPVRERPDQTSVRLHFSMSYRKVPEWCRRSGCMWRTADLRMSARY